MTNRHDTCAQCGAPAEAGFTRQYCSNPACSEYDADTAKRLRSPYLELLDEMYTLRIPPWWLP